MPGKKKISKFKLLLFSLVPVCVLLVSAEVVSRIYYKSIADALREAAMAADENARGAAKKPNAGKKQSGLVAPEESERFLQRMSNPAYLDKPWFSREFLLSSLVQPSFYTPDETRLILNMESFDKNITVFGGQRLTTGFEADPVAEPVKLFLLGASTTYCGEVPNEWTWSSQLQALLMEHGLNTRAHNLGTTTITSAQEVERLKYEIARGNIPDMLVLFNGVNDVLQGVHYKKPNGTILRTEKKLAVNKKKTLHTRLQQWSALYKLLSKEVFPFFFERTLADRLRPYAKLTAHQYERNVLAAQAVCRQHDIRFLVFLQPNLFTVRNRPYTEQEKNIYDFWGNLHTAYEVGYPLLKSKVRALEGSGVRIFDMTHLFDDLKKPIFLDFCHVESEGNRIIAEALFPYIREHLPKPKPPESGTEECDAGSLADGCVLALGFDEDSLYRKDGALFLRDASEAGHDGSLQFPAFVRVDNSTGLKPQDFTLSLKFNVSKFDEAGNPLFSKQLGGAYDNTFCMFFHDSDQLSIWIHHTVYALHPGVQENRWYHVVVRKKGIRLDAFLDGRPVATHTLARPELEYDPTPLILCGDDNTGDCMSDNHFKGRIEEAGFWNRALEDAEVLRLSEMVSKGHGLCAAMDLVSMQKDS